MDLSNNKSNAFVFFKVCIKNIHFLKKNPGVSVFLFYIL